MTMRDRSFRWLWILVLAAWCTTVGAAPESAPLLERVNQMARDMHMAQKVVNEAGDHSQQAAAFAREAASFEALKKSMATLNSPEELQKAAETLRQYGYKARSEAEKKAFGQGFQALESRAKFLTQTEGPAFGSVLGSISAVRVETERAMASQPTAPIGSAPRLAASRSQIRSSAGGEGHLGFEVKNGKTSFSVYSPAATDVNLILFAKPEDKSGTGYPMKKGDDGIWRCSIDGELYGKYYGFAADGPTTDGHMFNMKRLLNDPYALANVDHDGKSIVVKTDFTWSDAGFKPPAPKDLILYEMHVKDYTAHSSSGVSAANKGKYLGLTEGASGDKILGHLKDLGVNAVELLPCHEFDNNFAGHMNHWGYMTSHYFAPECSYASDKGGAQVKEFKQMVNAFHKAGIAVVMDVVFNHTTEGNEKGVPINFKGLNNPGYYRLTPDKKYYMNGTGCGNEFNSNDPMTRKLILDSLKYWVKEYHVDGFRFDLGTIIDKDTMNAIINDLPEHVILVGEPWAADWSRNLWGKTDFRNTKFAKWNDDFREKVRGLMGGNPERNDLMTVLAGSCFWWTAKPTESVNYIECHDGATVADLYKGDKRRIKIGAVALLTAQGIPMLHEGQEFMKSKKGNDNSYDQDNDINWIDWSVKKSNDDVYQFYKGLINLRSTYDNFRHATALNNQHIDWMQPGNHRAIGYRLKGKTDFLVLINSDANDWVKFQLPDANDWTIVCNGDKVDDTGKLGTAKGDYNVPSLTAVILKSK